MRKKYTIPELQSKKIKKKINKQDSPNYNRMPIVFSLEHISGDKYGFSALTNEEKKDFAESIFKRKNMTWENLKNVYRHKLGFEKIKKDRIGRRSSQYVTEDEKHFLIFRFSGKKPMVGHRARNIFYVLWFDKNFSLYDHG